ncbi:peptidoglycan recognition protein family protein [Leptospira interrogans]
MTFLIVNQRLAGVPFVATPHQGGRIEPTLIVLHDTAGRLDKGNSVSWFQNKASKVSAHLVVECDGSVTQMVDFDRTAWHAGTSEWRGRKGCNAFSVGIEIVSPGKLTKRGNSAVSWFGVSWPLDACVEMKTAGHGHGYWLPYTGAQIETVQRIVRALVDAYPTIADVVGHWQISPGRKVDCSPLFPVAECHAMVATRNPFPLVTVKAVQERLMQLGYWLGTVDGAIGPRTRSAIRTFQEQNGLPIDGELNAATLETLVSLEAKPMPAGSDPGAAIAATQATSQEAVIVQRVSEANIVYQVSDTITQASQAMQTAESAKGLGTRAGDIIGWLMTPAGFRNGLVILACIAIWFIARRMAKRGKPAPAKTA